MRRWARWGIAPDTDQFELSDPAAASRAKAGCGNVLKLLSTSFSVATPAQLQILANVRQYIEETQYFLNLGHCPAALEAVNAALSLLGSPVALSVIPTPILDSLRLAIDKGVRDPVVFCCPPPDPLVVDGSEDRFFPAEPPEGKTEKVPVEIHISSDPPAASKSYNGKAREHDPNSVRRVAVTTKKGHCFDLVFGFTPPLAEPYRTGPLTENSKVPRWTEVNGGILWALTKPEGDCCKDGTVTSVQLINGTEVRTPWKGGAETDGGDWAVDVDPLSGSPFVDGFAAKSPKGARFGNDLPGAEIQTESGAVTKKSKSLVHTIDIKQQFQTWFLCVPKDQSKPPCLFGYIEWSIVASVECDENGIIQHGTAIVNLVLGGGDFHTSGPNDAWRSAIGSFKKKAEDEKKGSSG